MFAAIVYKVEESIPKVNYFQNPKIVQHVVMYNMDLLNPEITYAWGTYVIFMTLKENTAYISDTVITAFILMFTWKKLLK